MSEEELVSIITPVYNGGRFLAETIESVLEQTYPCWEMIIIDDGSTDNSAWIAQEYATRDARIQLLRQANGGSASARNNGIRQARGRYIALLDADDVWEPRFLESQLALLKAKGAVVVYASYDRINERSEVFLVPVKARPQVTYKQMRRRNYIACLTGLYDTSQYGKIYLREELRSIRDDYAYWLDIVRLAGVAYGNPEILARYRVLRSSTTGNKSKLVKHQFLFYYKYQKLGLLRSCWYTLYWGVSGWLRFLY